MIQVSNNIEAAKTEAREYSIDNPTKYITLVSCFGLFIESKSRLHVNEPTDSAINTYWLNGIEKKFTNKQCIADQIATPTMS